VITVYLDPTQPDRWVTGLYGWQLGAEVETWLMDQGMRQTPWEPKPGQYMVFGNSGIMGPGVDFHNYDAKRVMMFKLMFGGR
jgi:hypothetical protein